MTDSDKIIKEFFIWMVREADIEVIDAENAIEVHSLKNSVGLVPVLTLDEFIDLFNNRMKDKTNNR